jgi:ubiquinone/menaquinone biosynthesis C-methylase UbiE
VSDVERFRRFCESDFGATVMDRESEYVKRHLEADDRILDVGCGIGSLEERLAEFEIVGVDQSRPMLEMARQRASAMFVLGDAERLPIDTDTVDVVLFVAALEFIPRVDTAIEEALRVLCSDGTLIALLLNTRSEYVQTHLQREDSYFQRMIHRDTEALERRLLQMIDGTSENILGIEDDSIVECADSTIAAVTAVVGSPQ